MHLADAFIQSDLQLHSGYTFFVSTCVPWEFEPTTFVLLTQCSNHWATGTQFSHYSLTRMSFQLHKSFVGLQNTI